MEDFLLMSDVLNGLVEENPQFLLLIEKDHIHYANKKFRETFGTSSPPQMLSGDWISAPGEQLKTMMLADHRKIVVYWHCQPLHQPDGRLLTVFIGEDRTEQERIRRRAEILSYIIRKVPGFVFWKDQDLKLMGCNDNFARQVGLSDPDEIIGLTDNDLPWDSEQTEKFHQDDQDVIQRGIKKLNIEEKQRQRDGRDLFLLTSKVPLYDRGKISGVLGIYIDITPFKEAEQALREQKEKAEVANRIKTDFILNMQHDIRTPIGGIWGIAELLLTEKISPNIHTQLVEVANAAKELLDYCNDLVDFANVDYGAHPLVNKPFCLKTLIDTVVKMQKPAANFKQLNLSVHTDRIVPKIVLGDAYRLKRILINLLSNAIKFTPQGQVKLMIHAEKAEDQNDRKVIVHFVVKDTGIGIPEEKIERIYEKFSKLIPSNKGLYKGSGLGLNLVKRFVTEMDGDIHVQSQINEGTVFTVFLPLGIPLSKQVFLGDQSL